jgi:hypothetical protein
MGICPQPAKIVDEMFLNGRFAIYGEKDCARDQAACLSSFACSHRAGKERVARVRPVPKKERQAHRLSLSHPSRAINDNQPIRNLRIFAALKFIIFHSKWFLLTALRFLSGALTYSITFLF